MNMTNSTFLPLGTSNSQNWGQSGIQNRLILYPISSMHRLYTFNSLIWSFLFFLDLNAVNQQLALMCIKSMAKLVSNEPSSPLIAEMKDLCSKLASKSFLKSLKLEPVIAAAMLCISELLSCLGAQGMYTT